MNNFSIVYSLIEQLTYIMDEVLEIKAGFSNFRLFKAYSVFFLISKNRHNAIKWQTSQL
jgi:hypothetical protein